MALRKTLVKRLINKSCSYGHRLSSSAATIDRAPSTHSLVPPNAVKTRIHREYVTSPEFSENSFFRRFLQRRAINQSTTRLPDFLSFPVGEKLREKLRSVNIAGNRLRLDDLPPPDHSPATAGGSLRGLTVEDARKLLRLSQVEKLKLKLREIPERSISYNEFVRICVDSCENEDQGMEFAKLLDQSGNVIVLGNIVFLRPEQVARSLESIICESVASPNDPRREELEQMEKQKAVIDEKTKALVRVELYCGLGFLTVQTLGFMRLTFWELTWDVMEPICFFATSLDFGLAYAFFLRTSTEPSFEGYFQRRFNTKQKKLMKAHNFDEEKYNSLRKLFYSQGFPNLDHNYKSIAHEEGRAYWRYAQ